MRLYKRIGIIRYTHCEVIPEEYNYDVISEEYTL